MDPFLAGSIVSGAANVGSNIINAFSNNRNNKNNVELWREQNAYNHPKEQMKRYQEAGLNPYLIYGSGGGGGSGNAAPPPTQNANSVDLRELGSAVSMYLDLKKKDTDIENTRTDIAGKTSDNQIKDNEAMLSNWAHHRGMQDLGTYEPNSILPPAYDKYRNEASIIRKDLDKMDTDIKDKQATISLLRNLKMVLVMRRVDTSMR